MALTAPRRNAYDHMVSLCSAGVLLGPYDPQRTVQNPNDAAWPLTSLVISISDRACYNVYTQSSRESDLGIVAGYSRYSLCTRR